ncbi:hypothetical protein N898_02255 [Salmonella enterica subsp. arizonae serovar 62:z36:- str. RKS2983]|nr:hypothetical protein N898_02255 [Salmonella enterica subsp. arizonae serovar 62:z36:- str. RKS2983]
MQVQRFRNIRKQIRQKIPDVLLYLQTFSMLKMLLKMFKHFQKAER